MPLRIGFGRPLTIAVLLSSALLLCSRGLTQRVHFAPGKNSAVLRNAVVRGDRDRYIVGAKAGQEMRVAITSVESNAVFQIANPRSGDLAGASEADDATKWTGTLPDSGDYMIVVGGTRGNADYTLTVTIN